MKKGFIAVVLVMLGTVMGKKMSEKYWKDKNSKEHEMSEKHFALFLMMNQWVKVKQERKQIAAVSYTHLTLPTTSRV